MIEPAAFPVDTPLRFRIGARTLATIPRRLVRVAWSLDDVLAGRWRALPPLGDADGYLLTSLPEALLGTLDTSGFAMQVRQRYPRHHVDLTIGHAAWEAGLSANARQSLRRKARQLAPDIRAYRTPDELAAFQTLARPLSVKTYQERMLDEGLTLPSAVTQALAEQDAVRAWLLFHGGAPIAYLWCTAEGDTLRYDHVGHDPAFAHLSPGAVLQAEAMRHLFEDRFTRFDFTEGDGRHKRRFATGATSCVDVVMLSPTLANHAALAALSGFDRAAALAKRAAQQGLAKRLGDRIRRAAARRAMHLSAPAIVLAVRHHGEHGAVVRALTRDDGVQPGYVRGGRSRALRPVLQPGNSILGEWRARTAEQLPALTVELTTTLAPLHAEPLAAAAIAWAAALTVSVLPEGQAYPRIHDALAGLLGAVAAAPSARVWAAACARYELLLLAELGFGLDLDRCAGGGGADDLAYVSPRSGGAVSREAAQGYEDRLLPLPAFLRTGGEASWDDIFAALRITGHFLERDLLTGRAADVLAARERLVERLKRAVA